MGNKRNSCVRLSRRSQCRNMRSRKRLRSTIERIDSADAVEIPSTSIEGINNSNNLVQSFVTEANSGHLTSSDFEKSESLPYLTELAREIPNKSLNLSIMGRRVVDIGYIFQQILNDQKHDPFDCSIVHMEVIGEQRKGLRSIFKLKCKMCSITQTLDTERPEYKANINNTVVLGAIATGIGYSQIRELYSVMNIPPMASKTFSKSLEVMGDVIHVTALNSMKEAAMEEKRLAELNGDVDIHGIPYITVITDGAWSKRSYNINYNALSGVACIIGYRTKKIIFIGVRNKYCTICERAKSNKNIPKQHKCYMNWTGTSTSMEADIILDGFKHSINMYGLKYLKLVADGDSSVYRKIIENKPYGLQIVEKIECINHLLRNFCKKIRELSERRRSYSTNSPVSPYLRSILRNSVKRFRSAITGAINQRKNEDSETQDKILLLQKDIRNMPSHIFGEHKECEAIAYFKCQNKTDINYVPEMEKCGMITDIFSCLNRLTINASSLLEKKDTNEAEHFNAIVCKLVGGKRINYSKGTQYQMRCRAATISYNSEGLFHSILTAADGSPPGIHTQKFVKESVNQRRKYSKLLLENRKKRKISAIRTLDADYGPNSQNTDISEEEYNIKKEEFLKNIGHDLNNIEMQTRGQGANPKWFQERAIRLTASRFGEVIKMRKTTKPGKKVESIVYCKFSGNEKTSYGNSNEHIAIKKFEEEYSLTVNPSGLFVCSEFPYLACSPDGLGDPNWIIEIKCSYKARNLTPQEGIIKKMIPYVKFGEDGEIILNRKHNYHFQIQGQLNITKRDFCYFVIYTPKGILVEKIYRDEHLWKNHMVKPLSDFYLNHMLPEIIDSRKSRNQPVRNEYCFSNN